MYKLNKKQNQLLNRVKNVKNEIQYSHYKNREKMAKPVSCITAPLSYKIRKKRKSQAPYDAKNKYVGKNDKPKMVYCHKDTGEYL